MIATFSILHLEEYKSRENDLKGGWQWTAGYADARPGSNANCYPVKVSPLLWPQIPRV